MKVYASCSWGPGEGPQGDDAVKAVLATWDLVATATGQHSWHQPGNKAGNPVTQRDVPALLDAGRIRDDGAGKVIESLGRGIFLYTDEGTTLAASTDGYARSWTGNVLIKSEHLPTRADEAMPVFEELIRVWRPRAATWGSKELFRLGVRLEMRRPRLGVLVWMREGDTSPFRGGETRELLGGTLYRFGDDLADVTPEVASQAIHPG